MAAPSDLHETRLFETVRLIREWVGRSFEPSQEDRFSKQGKLKARFDVDLGNNMRDQLQAYIKASFVLSRLHLRFSTQEDAKGKISRPCVEVVLDEKARSLFAEKHPDVVAKHRSTSNNGDAPKSIEGADNKLPLPASSEAPPKQVLDADANLPSTPALEDKKRKAHVNAETPPVQKRARERIDQRTSRGQTDNLPASPAATNQSGPGAASAWEVVMSRSVCQGVDGVREAKESLDACLAAQGPNAISRGSLVAIKAQKDAVAWLKGLADVDVTVQILQETRVSLTVNSWRKESDTYISGLATTLLRKWKAAYVESKASHTNAKQ